jgi:hypothetical protein
MRRLSLILAFTLFLISPALLFATDEILRPTAESNVSNGTSTNCTSTVNSTSSAMPNFYDSTGISTSSTQHVTNGSGGYSEAARDFTTWAAASNSYSALTLNVNYKMVNAGDSYHAGVAYSINGGTSWTDVHTGGVASATTYTVTLSTSQDLSQLRVRACMRADDFGGSGGDATMTGYDIWTAGTISTPTVANPTAANGTNTYNNTVSETLSDSTGSSVICYRTDGTAPAATTPGTCDSGSTTYSGAFNVSPSSGVTATVKALGTKSGYVNSSVVTFTYTFTVSAVSASPGAGTYSTAQSVTLSIATTTGASILYTVDGSTPSCPSTGTTYSTAISVGLTTTIKAIGCKTNYNGSSAFSALYTIQILAAPTFSPVAGSYLVGQYVTLSGPSGATLCYTVDNSTPTESGNACSGGTTATYAGISMPNPGSFTTATTGGTLAASTTYYYRVSATSAAGETLAFDEVGQTTGGSTSTNTVTPHWSAVTGATGYKVYCRTHNAEQLCTTIGSGATTSWTDTGSATPSGAVPTINSTLISVSSSETIKTLATQSGWGDSSVASGAYVINPPDQQLATDTFGGFFKADYNVDAINSIPTQLPLDTPWTGTTISSTQVSAWAAMGYGSNYYGSGYYAYPAIDSSLSSYGVRGGNTFGFATRTAEVYPSDQFSKAYLHKNTTIGSGIAVGTNCGTGSTQSGEILTVTNATSNNIQLFNGGSLIITVTVSVADGDSFEMRQVGNQYQPLQNGSQITGLSATYTGTASGGSPCIGASKTSSYGTNGPADAAGYNWSGGAIAASSFGVTPISWGGNTYSNYSLGTTLAAYASVGGWMPDGLPSSSMPTVGTVCCNVGDADSSQSAVGSTGNLSSLIRQAHYVVPESDNQWIHAKIMMDSVAWNNNNWFLKLQSEPSVPPVDMHAGGSGAGYNGCYDAWALYIGVEPMMGGSLGPGCTLEYCNTTLLHVTYANTLTSTPIPGTSPTQACLAAANYNITTATYIQYSPMHEDEVLAKINNGVLSMYCKGANSLGGWSANSTPTIRVTANVSGQVAGVTGTTIETSNGLYQIATVPTWKQNLTLPLNVYLSDGSHWQKVTTAGTTASSGGAPTWNHAGGTTTSGTITFTDMGALTTPTTGSTEPANWGETELHTDNGALTPDGTVTWQYVGEACQSDTAFQFVGSVPVAGFSGGWAGIWANNNAWTPSYGEFVFQDIRLGSGDPCAGTFTCIGGQQLQVINWVE